MHGQVSELRTVLPFSLYDFFSTWFLPFRLVFVKLTINEEDEYFLIRIGCTPDEIEGYILSTFNKLVIILVVVVVVNFIKHQNRAITGERVAARAAPLVVLSVVVLIVLLVVIK